LYGHRPQDRAGFGAFLRAHSRRLRKDLDAFGTESPKGLACGRLVGPAGGAWSCAAGHEDRPAGVLLGKQTPPYVGRDLCVL